MRLSNATHLMQRWCGCSGASLAGGPCTSRAQWGSPVEHWCPGVVMHRAVGHLGSACGEGQGARSHLLTSLFAPICVHVRVCVCARVCVCVCMYVCVRVCV
eukprot:1046781-Pelagomonas_calceolata.AAC.1